MQPVQQGLFDSGSGELVRAPINGEVLEWARQIGGFTREQLAQAVGKPGHPEVIAAWEQESEQPTARQLEELANKLKRPIATFFMPGPPHEPDPATALRRTILLQSRGLSTEIRLAIRTARYVRDRFAELLDNTNDLSGCKIPIAQLADSPEVAAAETRDVVGVSMEMQVAWPNDFAYEGWMEALLRVGVLTQQFSVPLDQAWGFSITDGPMPLAAVNRKLYYRVARTFTLLHEVGHIALRDSAISVIEPTTRGPDDDEMAHTEHWCNKFSAAFLLPIGDPLVKHALDKMEAADVLESSFVQRLASKFRVSKYVLLGRFRDIGGISEADYKQLRSDWWVFDSAREQARLKKEREKSKEKKSGPVQWQLALADRGRPMTARVLQALGSGRISESEAGDLLGFSTSYLDRAEQFAFGKGEI